MKILLFSDGTGNTGAKVARTNVWRFYEALDLSKDQVAIYDNGVGTSSFGPLAMLGGAFGWGLKRNVLDLYRFLCRNYAVAGQDGTPVKHQVYAFGFSRGAFTIRVLLGLLQRQGIVKYTNDERELRRLARCAFRAYRAEAYGTKGGLARALGYLRNLALDAIERRRKRPYRKEDNHRDFQVEFVGLWDTVAAYGFPIDEVTRGWDKWIRPLTLSTQNGRFVSSNVKKACHALALDDERQTFHPVLWNELGTGNDTSTRISDEKVSQVWFAGMHSNVGGGYADDGMAYDSLCWIAQQATSLKDHPVALRPDVLEEWKQRRSTSSPMADSRKGLAGYYRYLPRLLEKLTDDMDNPVRIDRMKIHHSVFKRGLSGVAGYAPIVLPSRYAVVDDDGNIRNLPEGEPDAVSPFVENAATAALRHSRQSEVWDLVWRRRVTYFLTLLFTAVLVALPWVPLDQRDPVQAWQFRQLSVVIRLVGSVLPDALAPLITHYADFPVRFLLFAVAVWLCMRTSKQLDARIDDRMREIWRSPAAAPRRPGLVRRIRTAASYLAFMSWSRHTAMPNALGLTMATALVVGSAVTVLRASVSLPVTLGEVCKGSGSGTPVTAEPLVTKFSTNDLCSFTTWKLAAGATYEISMTPTSPWMDSELRPVDDFNGFSSFDRVFTDHFWEDGPFYVGWTLRRHLELNWFVPVARVGARGGEYFPLEPHAMNPKAITTNITPRIDGELFLYVNDAVGIRKTSFYENNKGEAEVRIRRVR